MEREIEIKGRKMQFGNAANNDYIQDATDADPQQWIMDKHNLFSRLEDGQFAYKGQRDFLEVLIYSGLNNYARVVKDRSLRVTVEEAKEFYYELESDERTQVVSAYVSTMADAGRKNGKEEGEKEAQPTVVS